MAIGAANALRLAEEQKMGMAATVETDQRNLELRLLGSFRAIASTSNDDVTPRGKKTRALLAYVALSNGGQVTRERAAGLLWSDRSSEQARVSLRQCLAELRSLSSRLDDIIVADRERITVDVQRVRTDIDQIVAADPTGDIESFTQHLEGYDGEFLDDLYGLSPGFDEWLLFERPRRRDLLVAAALRVATSASKSEDTGSLRNILASLERIDPGNEQAARLGMQADRSTGDLASLHRRYRQLVDTLKREFDAQPSDDTRQMFYELTQLSTEVGGARERAMPGVAKVPTDLETVPVIIVVPLTAIDQALDTSQLAAICTDDIRTALARHRDLRVIPIDQPDLERIQRVCGGSRSSYLLSGSIRSAGGVLRCNVQLSLAVTGVVLWSDQVVITDATIEEAIDRIVGRTVGAVAPVVERDLTGQVAAEMPSEKAVMLYARARRQLYQARDFGTLQDAANKLEQVVASDTAHANARLLLAQLYNTDFFQRIAGHDPQPYRARAFELALRAAALDPDNPVAQLRLAWCFLRRGDWQDAMTRYERAADLSRFDSLVLDEAAFGFCHAGDYARSEHYFRLAFQLNPFPPADFHADFAVLLALTGQSRAAEEQFEASSETALHYIGVRLANLVTSGRKSPPELADTLWRKFGEVWVGATPWRHTDLVDWILIYLPLRDAKAQEWLREGLTRALAQCGSATSGNG